MKFLPIAVEDAAGALLGHNISDGDGRRVLRKGRALSADDIQVLRQLGRKSVYVAQLEAGDVDENRAADRIASAITGNGLRPSTARTGRVNLYAEHLGVLQVDLEQLLTVNTCEGLSFSTLPRYSPTPAGKKVATLKIIPYALPERMVQEVEARALDRPIIHLQTIPQRRVGLVLSASPNVQERVVRSFQAALEPRLQFLGATLESVDFVPLEEPGDEARLAEMLTTRLSQGLEMLLLAGETAIMDRHDIAPRAVERAGGKIVAFGVPVDPGNLLLLAEYRGIPIVGAPGCSRSAKQNIIDLILPRLLAGERLDRAKLIALSHGGLLEDVPERPLPRSWIT